MESGSCVAGAPWGAWNATAMQASSRAIALSVNATDLASLRHVPSDTLLNSPFFNLAPSADGWYMERNPAELPVLTKGVDIIVGANTMDSLNAPPYIGTIPQLPDFTPKGRSAFKTLATDYFGVGIFEVYPEPAASASQDDVAKAFYRMQGDVCNQCPKHFAAQKFLAADETVFVYEFAFARAPWKGLPCHGCELYDVFNFSEGEQFELSARGHTAPITAASYDAHLGDTMTRYWASFIKTGLKSGQPVGNPTWPEYTGAVQAAKSLDISTGAGGEPQISIQSGLDSQRCDFFEKFIKTSSDNMQKFLNFCNWPVPLSFIPVDPTIVV